MTDETFYLENGDRVGMLSRVPDDPTMVIVYPKHKANGWMAPGAFSLKDLATSGNGYAAVLEAYNALPPLDITAEQREDVDNMVSELVTLKALYGDRMKRIKELETSLRAAAASTGQSYSAFGVQVNHVEASVSTSWDKGTLDKLAETIPAINKARKVTMRKAGGAVRNADREAGAAREAMALKYFDLGRYRSEREATEILYNHCWTLEAEREAEVERNQLAAVDAWKATQEVDDLVWESSNPSTLISATFIDPKTGEPIAMVDLSQTID